MLQPTTVLVWGASHSGSTLIGFLLGSHDNTVTLGEWINYCTHNLIGQWGYETWPALNERRRIGGYSHTCSQCGPACTLWTRPPPELPLKNHYQHIRKYLNSRLGAEPVSVLCDTSKHWWFLEKLVVNSPSERFVHVVPYKEPWDFVAGVLLRGGHTLTDFPEELVHFNATAWSIQVADSLRAIDRVRGQAIIVPYADLAQDPRRALLEVAAQARIKLDPIRFQYWNYTHHQIAGNPSAHHNLHLQGRVAPGSLRYSPSTGIEGLSLDPVTGTAPEKLRQRCLQVPGVRALIKYIAAVRKPC